MIHEVISLAVTLYFECNDYLLKLSLVKSRDADLVAAGYRPTTDREKWLKFSDVVGVD